MSRAILFDFNGVIVNDEPQHCEALIATLATYGFTLDRDGYYRDYLGFDDRECFRFTFRRMGLPADDELIHQAIERKAVLYEQAIRESLELVPGSSEFIRTAAASGYRLALVSGALRREIELVLAASKLRQYFEVLIAAEDVSACKPDPEGYRMAARQLGLPASACMIIEDSIPGLHAALAAGMRCTMITTSHRPDELTDADTVWTNLSGHQPSDLPWTS